jgi:microcystin-dependent protein
MFAGTFAPVGWAFCDGQLFQINQHQSLYSLLGTTYGGDGRTTFGLPDLRGRAPIHAGPTLGGSYYEEGQTGGAETVTLSIAQMPAHAHGVSAKAKAVASPGNQGSPVGHAWAEDGAGGAFTYSDSTRRADYQDMKAGSVAVTEQNFGESQSHENWPPYQVIRYIISLDGEFPSRN